MELIFTLRQIDIAAVEFISLLSDYRIVAINGIIGAGKTTFIHAICRKLNVTDKMSSPTYSIINQYKANNGIIINHIDLFRLKAAEEAIHAGVEDALLSGDYCFIEWAEKIAEILPFHTLNANLEILEDNQRKLVVKFR